MEYLTSKQILLIHSMIIKESGGTHGLRDSGAILSLVASPKQKVFNKELYPSLFKKAATYARGIIMMHPFVDGNKRTGMVAASVFLENNGFKITAKEGEIEKFALEIVNNKPKLKQIAQWLQEHSKKRKKE